MKIAKFELSEGEWLVTVRKGRAKIKSRSRYITFKEESFLKVNPEINNTSKAINKAKRVI